MARSPVLSVALLAGIAAMATPAVAQDYGDTSQRTLAATGSAPQVCVIDQAQIQAGELNNIVGIDGDTLRIDELTDKQTLAARATSATLSFPAVCNFPHRVRIESESNGLWPTDGRMYSEASGFAYALPYTAEVRWGPGIARFAADAKIRRVAQSSVNIDEPTAGNLEMRIEIEPGASNVRSNAPVLAGTYGDVLRIFLEPR